MPASDAVPSAAAALTLSSGSWMRVTHMLAEYPGPGNADQEPHLSRWKSARGLDLHARAGEVGGLAVGVAQLSLHARRRGEPLEEERLSYLSLQRHAAVEYGEVRSVVAQTWPAAHPRRV